jgi:hypothetical protein
MIATAENIKKVRPISENIDTNKRINPYIEEAEKLFVIPNIGAATYKAIEADKTSYVPLLDGGYYDNDTRYFSGLYEAIGYLAYSRFVRNQPVNATVYGMVTKQSPHSEPVDPKTLISVANDSEKIGLQYLKQCVDFLNFGKERDQQRPFKGKRKFIAIG